MCVHTEVLMGKGSNSHSIFKGICDPWASRVALVIKNPPANAGEVRDTSLIPGLGRSPGEGNGSLLQYSGLGNPMTEEPGGLQSIRSQELDTT